MNSSGITWRGDSIDDVEILCELPASLNRILADSNGFILHEGAVHVRGASLSPEWHSIRAAWKGEHAFYKLYEGVRPSDIPFAQDLFGDQFLIRDNAVLRLLAETGDVELLTDSIEEFFRRLSVDVEHFLNVGLTQALQPGELLLAYPPFVCRESGLAASLKVVRADGVIRFHADFARQIRDVPDGGQVEFRIKT
jgi:hypothetical protein